ncbi:MAG: hypothetical protein V7K57_23425 [Nostoc sp.]
MKPLKRANFQDYYNQGVQKLEQGSFTGAIADFNSVVQQNPQFYEGFCLRGLAKSQLNKVPSNQLLGTLFVISYIHLLDMASRFDVK